MMVVDVGREMDGHAAAARPVASAESRERGARPGLVDQGRPVGTSQWRAGRVYPGVRYSVVCN